MKKYALFLLAVLFIVIVGCKKNDISNDSGDTVIVNGPLCFTAEEPGATIGMYFNTMYGWIFDTVAKPNIEYSFDKVNWETLTISSTAIDTSNSITLENVGDKVYFRGENPLGLNPYTANCQLFQRHPRYPRASSLQARIIKRLHTRLLAQVFSNELAQNAVSFSVEDAYFFDT